MASLEDINHKFEMLHHTTSIATTENLRYSIRPLQYIRLKIILMEMRANCVKPKQLQQKNHLQHHGMELVS